MRPPESGRREYHLACTVLADGKHSTLDATCPPDEGLVSPDARWVAFPQKIGRGVSELEWKLC